MNTPTPSQKPEGDAVLAAKPPATWRAIIQAAIDDIANLHDGRARLKLECLLAGTSPVGFSTPAPSLREALLDDGTKVGVTGELAEIVEATERLARRVGATFVLNRAKVEATFSDCLASLPASPEEGVEPVAWVSESALSDLSRVIGCGGNRTIIWNNSGKPMVAGRVPLFAAPPLSVAEAGDAGGEAVAIKPLEWEEPSWASNWCWTAKSPIGTYWVVNEGGWYVSRDDVPRDFYFEWTGEDLANDTLATAKAAAQRDFEGFVRSCLAPSLSPSQPEGGAETER